MVSHPTLHRPTTHEFNFGAACRTLRKRGLSSGRAQLFGFLREKTLPATKGSHPKGRMTSERDRCPNITSKRWVSQFQGWPLPKEPGEISIKSHSCCHVASCERYSPKSTRITETTVHRRQGNILYIVVHVLFLCISSTSIAAGDSKLCDFRCCDEVCHVKSEETNQRKSHRGCSFKKGVDSSYFKFFWWSNYCS